MIEEYIKVNAATTYLDFTVSAEKPVLMIQRSGGGCRIRAEPLSVKGCTATFHIYESCFGLPDGWYELHVMDGCFLCLAKKLKIDSQCTAQYVGSEDTVYNVKNLTVQG